VADFVETALSFPASVYSALLAVVIVYWVVVMLGVLGIDVFEGDDGEIGPAGFLAGLGLGGIPVSVVVSLLIAFGWFATFAGTVLFDALGATGPARVVGGAGVLVAATVAAYPVTYLVVLPLRRLFPDIAPASRADFVGSYCTVRTSTVDGNHGQAEVTAPDGSSAIIQVRQTGDEHLRAGSTALIFDYDSAGEFFWITAATTELEPGS
jgi:hypothetical protein